MSAHSRDAHETDLAAAADVDFAQLMGLSEAAWTNNGVNNNGDLLEAPEPLRLDDRYCPLHPGADDCACYGFLGDWDVPEPVQETSLVGEPDYSIVENYIPQFIRPRKPCDYCQAKRLQCYMRRGEPCCTPCSTLFRDCSLAKINALDLSNHLFNGSLLDTLHVVAEDIVMERGTATGVKPLKSGSGTSTPTRLDDAPGSTKRNGIRFPKAAVKILRDWLESHADNPYPTEEQKAELEESTELKPSQIANWLANARRRRKVTEKARPRIAMSPSLRPKTAAIPIPARVAEKSWEELNPFERWKNSPPENEPASMTDIANAIATTDIPDGDVSASPSTLGRSKRRNGSSNGSGFSHRRATSTTSQETGLTSSISASSAAFSNGSSHSTHGSFNSFSSSLAGKKDRRRRRRPTAPTPRRQLSDDKKRIFQCTFCCDTFRNKYDWTRHEKSLHLSLEKWICAPLGPVTTDQETGSKKCVYCDLNNPSSDHIESHNHRSCEEKGFDARTFYRKDHLRQHLRLFHGCDVMSPSTESWKAVTNNINCRCGFCGQRFTTWSERVDHIAAHFKAGARMGDWKGCRGLDPTIAAQVTNAMPPYLIGMESITPAPFSATNRASQRDFLGLVGGVAPDHMNMLDAHNGTDSSKTTCWELLTVKLGNYVKQQADKGAVITDEMLQSAARQILYGSDDSWNQTSADNAEWLDLFKKAHGLKYIPATVGGQGEQVPDDLETYGDLGLRIPFALQLQAYNESQCNSKQVAHEANIPEFYQQVLEARRVGLNAMYSNLCKEDVFYDGDQRCDHQACSSNFLDVSTIDGDPSPGPRTRRWCNKGFTTDISERVCHSQGVYPAAEGCLGGDSSARARGLAALARIEAFEAVSDGPRAGTHLKKSHKPHHRYELPKDQAKLFETVTGPWQDSGMMPDPSRASVSQVTFEPEIVENTTPLLEDPSFDWQTFGQADNSTMPPGSNQGFYDGAALMDVDMTWDELIAPPASEMSNQPGTDDVNFDEFTFDGVFDMPVNESFCLGNGSV